MGELVKALELPPPAQRSARRAVVHGVARWGPALPLISVLAFCLLAPIVVLLSRSFITVDGIGLSAWSRVLSAPINQRAILTSLELGLICASISLVVGTPLAWLVSRMLVGRRAAWLGLLNVAAHFGGIGLAFAYVVTLGTFGVVTLLVQSLGVGFEPPPRDSLLALVIAYEHANIPLFVLLMVPAMGMLREEWWEAAQASSATRLQFWRRVGLPLLLPFLAAGFVLSFTWSIGIFGIAYALAGQSAALPIQLITLQIGQALYDDAIRGPERAAVLSVLLMMLAAGALLVYRALLRRGTRWLAGGVAPSITHTSGRRPIGGRASRIAAVALFGGFALYLFVPIGALLLYSIAGRWTSSVLPDTFTLQHWLGALTNPRIVGAFWTSLTLGLWTTLIALALTVPAAYWARVRNPRIRPVLELSAAIPFALPFVVVGFALLHFTGMLVPPLQGSYALVVLAYVAVSFPFVYWALDGALAAADVRRLSEAAAAAGASSWQTVWRVVLPNIRTGIATAAMLAFALAIGEFALVKMLAGSLNTVPLLSATMMNASGGSFAPLAVMTTVVFVMLFAISVGVAWLNRDRLTSTYAGPGR